MIFAVHFECLVTKLKVGWPHILVNYWSCRILLDKDECQWDDRYCNNMS